MTQWSNVDGRGAGAAAHYLDTMMRVLAAQKQRSTELLRLRPGMSVIEIGCGNGRDAEALAKLVGPTGRVIGIDASQELISQATERTASLGLPLRFQVDDAHALAFPDNSFDAARVDRVLQHLNDPAQAVREMARVVRPGGLRDCLGHRFVSGDPARSPVAIDANVVSNGVDPGQHSLAGTVAVAHAMNLQPGFL